VLSALRSATQVVRLRHGPQAEIRGRGGGIGAVGAWGVEETGGTSGRHGSLASGGAVGSRWRGVGRLHATFGASVPGSSGTVISRWVRGRMEVPRCVC